MFRRYLTAAVMALATAGFATTAAAGVGVATFNSQTAFRCHFGTTEQDHGLSFSGDPQNPFFSCFYSPAAPADSPINPTSTFMEVGFDQFEVPDNDTAPFVVQVSQSNGLPFDLIGFDLAAGNFAPLPSMTGVTGFVHGGGTLSATLDLTSAFATHDLNWLNLDSFTFGPPSNLGDGTPYIALDNVRYGSASVPEPFTWMLMLSGLLGSGYMLRRARQLAAVEA